MAQKRLKKNLLETILIIIVRSALSVKAIRSTPDSSIPKRRKKPVEKEAKVVSARKRGSSIRKSLSFVKTPILPARRKKELTEEEIKEIDANLNALTGEVKREKTLKERSKKLI